jgi:hypothetical protein
MFKIRQQKSSITFTGVVLLSQFCKLDHFVNVNIFSLIWSGLGHKQSA